MLTSRSLSLTNPKPMRRAALPSFTKPTDADRVSRHWQDVAGALVRVHAHIASPADINAILSAFAHRNEGAFKEAARHFLEGRADAAHAAIERACKSDVVLRKMREVNKAAEAKEAAEAFKAHEARVKAATEEAFSRYVPRVRPSSERSEDRAPVAMPVDEEEGEAAA